MASTRSKRTTAGNRMAKLLNEEEEDEFYKTTYGGFEETEQDNDYKYVCLLLNIHEKEFYKCLNFSDKRLKLKMK